jgi:hypothetical protein
MYNMLWGCACVKGEAEKLPGLRDVAKQLLQTELGKIHDSAQDAKV